jgi:Universal stress protein family
MRNSSALETTLIPINTAWADIPRDVVEMAARLAPERKAAIEILAFTDVPLCEDIDVEIRGLDQRLSHLFEQARGVARPYGITLTESHVRTRDAAASILAEARRRRARLILISSAGLQRAEHRSIAHDDTVKRVIAEAAQRVMIVQPAAKAA